MRVTEGGRATEGCNGGRVKEGRRRERERERELERESHWAITEF